MKIEILVDSDVFWADLKTEILNAKNNVYAQTMSFEGDEVGTMFSEALQQSPATDKRLLLDSYINAIINDKFYYHPANWFDKSLWNEIRATRELIKKNNEAGVLCKFTNPLGFLFYKLIIRNHKKLVVIDDRIAYIGGINFCDHNFYWHDMMLRIEETNIVAFLKLDFQNTWDGKNIGGIKEFDQLTFITLDQYNNEKLFNPIFDVIASAKKSITLESPYLTFPFCEALREAVNRGISVTIISPDANNWGLMRNYMLWEANRSGFDLRLYQGKMSHLKGILIDDEIFVAGSSNYDFLSYRGHIENFAIIRNLHVAQQFKKRVIEPDLANSRKLTDAELKTDGRWAYRGMKFLDFVAAGLKKIT